MRECLCVLCKFVGFSTLGLVGLAGVLMHVAHPDLTETRLFLDYWWLWIGGGLVSAAITVIGQALDA